MIALANVRFWKFFLGIGFDLVVAYALYVYQPKTSYWFYLALIIILQVIVSIYWLIKFWIVAPLTIPSYIIRPDEYNGLPEIVGPKTDIELALLNKNRDIQYEIDLSFNCHRSTMEAIASYEYNNINFEELKSTLDYELKAIENRKADLINEMHLNHYALGEIKCAQAASPYAYGPLLKMAIRRM